MPETSYYYYIYSAKLGEKYEILHDPGAWKFPAVEDLLEFHWQQWSEVFGAGQPPPGDYLMTNVSALVMERDGACRLTGTLAMCGCQPARIIPGEMSEWFIENEMEIFAKDSKHGANETTRPSNMCVLRNDVHWMFDQHFFTFVPKQGQLVVHFLDTDALPACRAFHNASVSRPTDLAGEYFLARLAVAVIPKTRTFNRRYGTLQVKSTKKRARGEDSEGGGGKKPKPAQEDKNDSSMGGPAVPTPRNADADSNDNVDDEERELEEDMKLAMRRLPYIFCPDWVPANPKLAFPEAYRAHQVDTLDWYPGRRRVQRMKEAYVTANPQVRATSSRDTAEGDSESSAGSIHDA